MLGWALGILAIVAVTAIFWPSVRGSASFDDVIRDLPANLRAIIGAGGEVSLGSPAGYLNARVFATVLPVVLSVFGISHGARALAGSEEDGTLELVLANPVTRVRVLLERGLAVGGLVLVLGGVAFGALVVVGRPIGLLDGIPTSRVLGACLGLTVLAGFHASIAFAVGAARGRRSLAVGVAAAVAVAGYLLEGLLATSTDLRWLRSLSPWHWLLSRNVLLHGPPLWPLVVQLGIAGVLVVGGALMFTARDLR
jgi:ABC-2 type transport system permease protein